MSDLVEKAKWMKAHDDAAFQIGQRGRALAESLDYAGELKTSARTFTAARRYFSGRPEAALRFGTAEDDNVDLCAGWLQPEAGGVSAARWKSRLELPRPMAVKDFILTLDVSPAGLPAMPTAQRLTVVANGEILRQATLLESQDLHCIPAVLNAIESQSRRRGVSPECNSRQ
jgi:hypothetical protein